MHQKKINHKTKTKNRCQQKDFPKEMRKTIETPRENSKKYRKRQRQIVCRDHIILAPSPSFSSSYLGNSDREFTAKSMLMRKSLRKCSWGPGAYTQPHRYTHILSQPWLKGRCCWIFVHYSPLQKRDINTRKSKKA